jgi:carbohydrate kinase (thermoresistant glucokinase family)
MIVVVMGVSGSGKSTVGAALARALDCPFVEADDLHPPANVAKMAAGVPLNDDDRWPWLDLIVEMLRVVRKERADVVLACSALKQIYRDRLASAGETRFVHLRGDPETIADRLAKRQHRYMPSSLLASQFATLEPPVDAIEIDIRSDVATQVRQIIDALGHPRSATTGGGPTSTRWPDDRAMAADGPIAGSRKR